MSTEYQTRRRKVQCRAQNEDSNGEDFSPAVSAAIVPLCFWKVKHLGCDIWLPHRAPGKNNLKWFHFYIKTENLTYEYMVPQFMLVKAEHIIGIQERGPFQF